MRALVDRLWPVEASRRPGLAGALALALKLEGTRTSCRARGDWARRGSHSMTMAYWFRSAYRVAICRWPKAL